MMTETVDKSLEIAAIGIAGVFVFMILFYLMIMWLDKLFPFRETPQVEKNQAASDEKER